MGDIENKPLPEKIPPLNPSAFARAFQTVSMRVTKRAIQSFNFVTGASGAGWKITAEGNIEASAGDFRGTITATTGTIGGWTIGATSLVSGSGATTVGLDSGGSNPALYAGNATPGSAPFRVTGAGVLTASSGTIGGFTIGATTLSSATSGERLVLDQGNANLDLINASGSTVLQMDYGSSTGDPILTVTVVDDNRIGIKITTGDFVADSLFIDNNSDESGSVGILVDRDGSSASELFGAEFFADNAGSGDATAINADGVTGVQLTGCTNAIRATVDGTDPTSGFTVNPVGRIRILDGSENVRYLAVYT